MYDIQAIWPKDRLAFDQYNLSITNEKVMLTTKYFIGVDPYSNLTDKFDIRGTYMVTSEESPDENPDEDDEETMFKKRESPDTFDFPCNTDAEFRIKND